ncbi:MAG: DUF2946 family protein [Aquisalimonadaceae bacterium]
MDDSVIRAMARWPNVPAVFGYLALDARGRWLLNGRPLDHEQTVNFINRNYGHDDHGRWYFQNGPQRVYIALACTPWVYRLRDDRLDTHTGVVAGTVSAAWLDEQGRLLLYTDQGIGLLHDQDLPEAVDRLTDLNGNRMDEEQVLNALEQLHSGGADLYLHLGTAPVPLASIRSDSLAARFHFQPQPTPQPEEIGER